MNMLSLAIVAMTLPSVALATGPDSQRVLQERIDAREAVAPFGDDPNTCGSAPLPLTPQGPVSHTMWQFGTGDAFHVAAWRIPCSASASMPVLTVTPTAGSDPSFLCGAGLVLVQSGGLQTDNFGFYLDPGVVSSYCDDVIAAVTISIVPRSNTPANFDMDQGMTIDYDGASAGHQTISIGAFNPADYNLTPPAGPDAVEVHVRGAASHFRNCYVTILPTGSGTRYTASCADETPLKAGGFERYDY